LFSGENLSNLLYAIATGHRERAKNLVYTHEELTDDERELLRPIVEDDAASGSELARRIGDALRTQGEDQAMVNECYRLAFYASGASARLSSNPLYAYFLAHRTGRLLDKWVHYFSVYDAHLAPWRDRAPRVLEIGVYQGGSLDLWEHYLGPSAVLVGIDVDEAAVRMSDPRRTIALGDQADPDFLRSVVAEHGPFDVIIDDGGHTMEQQIVSIETLFPLLRDGGVYLVEDTHTSYWESHGGGLHREGSFIEWVKDRLDDLHAYHRSEPVDPVWTDHVAAVHCYDSVVVLDKEPRFAPFCENAGGSDFVYVQRHTSAMVGEMLATRDAALRELEEHRHSGGEDLRVAAGELAALRPRATELEAELRRLDEELTVTRNDLLEAWAQLRSMRHTLSWRITAPLRLVRRGMGNK
jgi:hypothetical protein